MQNRTDKNIKYNFAGKTVVVSGATGEIGARVCRLLASSGAQVILLSRDAVKLSSLVRELVPSFASHSSYVIDFSNSESITFAISAIEKSGAKIDGLVLIYPSVPKVESPFPTAEEWRKALDLCFVNPLLLLQETALTMNVGARVTVVTGIAGSMLFPNLAISNAVRAAWRAQVKFLAHRLGKNKIRLNSIALGKTATEDSLSKAQLITAPPYDAMPESPDNIPLGEFGNPEDATTLIVGYLSDLSNHVTGEFIRFDGGFTRTY